MVRAIADTVPALNATFTEDADGKPRKVVHEHVSLGLAVDLEKSDGSRTLLVPVIKDADTLDFSGFWAAYEDIIRKVRTGKLAPDDFAGTTVTLTNPGTIGTVQSVPRLMPGQGAIIGVGRLDFPAAFEGADPAALADLGMSKVMTVSSTYDHRIIQGAESGLFLKRVAELLMGEDDFYGGIFRAIGVPYEAVRWRQDSNPVEKDEAFLQKQIHVQTLINMYRVRGHLIADLDPLAAKEPSMHSELDPATYGLTIWDLEREFLTDGLAGEDRMALGDMLGVLRNAYCRRIGIEYMHIQEPDREGLDPGAGRGRRHHGPARGPAPHPGPAQRGRGLREVPGHQVRRPEALRHRGGRVGHPDPRRHPREGRRRRPARRGDGHGPPRPPQRACPTSWASPSTSSSPSSRATSTPTPPRARAT